MPAFDKALAHVARGRANTSDLERLPEDQPREIPHHGVRGNRQPAPPLEQRDRAPSKKMAGQGDRPTSGFLRKRSGLQSETQRDPISMLQHAFFSANMRVYGGSP